MAIREAFGILGRREQRVRQRIVSLQRRQDQLYELKDELLEVLKRFE